MPSFKDNVLVAVTNTPGVGAVTVGAASDATYRAFAAGDDGLTFEVTAVEPAVGTETWLAVYTHAGTSLSRGTLLSSTTGARISLTAAAVVRATASAQSITRFTRLLQMVTPGGRLTLESGVPVSTTDQTAKTSVFYIPYTHNGIVLWDGVDWVPTTFTEVTQALGTITSGLPYDVFGFLNGSALNTEILAWTNGTTRATAVTLQDGRYCKSGDKTRLLLGSFYTTSTTTTEDSLTSRYLWNTYNRTTRDVCVRDTTVSWTYNSVTIRQARGATSNQINVMCGLPGSSLVSLLAGMTTAGNTSPAAVGHIGIGENSTTGELTSRHIAVYPTFDSLNAATAGMWAQVKRTAPVGRNYYAQLEVCSSAQTITFYGSNAGGNMIGSGLSGSYEC